MNVAQLLHKLPVISNIEIVVPLLPEMIRIANQTPRYSLLQRLQRIGQGVLLRLAELVDIPTQSKTGLEWGTARSSTDEVVTQSAGISPSSLSAGQ